MDEDRVQLVYFEICGERFAFHMEYLVEIVQAEQSDITPYYSPVPMIRGTWDYRGKLLYIIDIRDFFGLEDKLGREMQGSYAAVTQTQHESLDSVVEHRGKKTHPKSIIVVNIRGQMFGLLTDVVLQVVPLIDFYEYPNMLSTLPKRYFAGVTLINSQLVLLLAIQDFINDYEQESLLSHNTDSGNRVQRTD